MCRRLSSSHMKLSSLWGQWPGKEKAMQTHKWTWAAGGDGIWSHFQGWQVSADELKVQNRPDEWTECWYLELLLMFSRQGWGQRNVGISPSQSFADTLGHLTMLITTGFNFMYFLLLLVGYFFGYFHSWFSYWSFISAPCGLSMLPCFLGFPLHLQIFSWTTFHPLQLFLFAVFTGDSTLFPCWFSQCVCSRKTLVSLSLVSGHICWQIHM